MRAASGDARLRVVIHDRRGCAVTQETGTAYVPEFGVLGAIAVLGGAAFVMNKRRKE